MQKQLIAGYILSTAKTIKGTDLPNMWRSLSAFTCDGDIPLPPKEVRPEIAVLSNLISRGLPTLPSPKVEGEISERCHWACREDSVQTGGIEFRRNCNDAKVREEEDSLIARAFRAIDPRLNRKNVHWGISDFPGSTAESEFLYSIMPDAHGDYLCQLLEPQRPLALLVTQKEFKDQRADFGLQFPVTENASLGSGIVIEIDGPDHDPKAQQLLDAKRDTACQGMGIRTIRIPARTLRAYPLKGPNALSEYLKHDWVRRYKYNYEHSLIDTKEGRRALQLALSPFGVARIQKVLVEALRLGVLALNGKEWSIGVIEQDVPCARLAVADFVELLTNYMRLLDPSYVPPAVELRVYKTPEFEDCELDQGTAFTLVSDEQKAFNCDLLIDIAMLSRQGLSVWRPTEAFRKKVASRYALTIRTAYHPDAIRRIESSKPLKYVIAEGERQDSLRYILQMVFRKIGFRPGQVAILRSALARENVIGLLPTGAGKSLTYQLPAMLQPGVAIIVDPLKSLMQDQVEELSSQYIDAVAFINSQLTPTMREIRQGQMRDGCYQFVFVSPERFLIREFRLALEQMKDAAVTYCVVDEAHCVSEWGHDFRTAYLRLGRNARSYCRTQGDPVCIIALTGTASFDVLADVKRELELGSETAIVTPPEFGRKELKFEVRKVNLPRGIDKPKWKDFSDQKYKAVSTTLREIAEVYGGSDGVEGFLHHNSKLPNTGLIFCPHVGNAFGVKSVLGHVQGEFPGIAEYCDYFAGSSDGDGLQDFAAVQAKYKNNDLRLLVATKAFGMGINKPNVRFTIHLVMPQSIESFYQEAGRAGRDREDAYCYILFCPDKSWGKQYSIDKELMLNFHSGSFKGEEFEQRVMALMLDPGKGREDLENSIERESAIVIGFESLAVPEIVKLLSTQYKIAWDEDKVRSAIAKSANADELASNLQKEFWKITGKNTQIPPALFQKVYSQWLGYRSESDTMKAVYRLSVAGCIKDYELNYKTRSIKLELVKPADYYKQFESYLARYLPPAQVTKVLTSARKRGGNNLRNCLWEQIDFVYGHIAKRRLEAINQMEAAILLGLDGGNFTEHINTYFDSRYTPELREFRDSPDIQTVWDYIDRTAGTPDLVNHLWGACNRLLVESPDHGAYLLLRCFAQMLAPGSSKASALSDYRRGWSNLQDVHGWSRVAYSNNLKKFRQLCLSYDAKLKPLFDNDIARMFAVDVAQTHIAWLKEFTREVPAGVVPPKPGKRR